jgi:hypothetical protein
MLYKDTPFISVFLGSSEMCEWIRNFVEKGSVGIRVNNGIYRSSFPN